MWENNFIFEQVWSNPYNLAIISCVHWDETLWLKVIEELKKKTIKNVTYIVANKKAREANVRFIDSDLNRCFIDNKPLNTELSFEKNISYELDIFLKKFNYIIDLHSTFFDVPWYFIIDKIDKINLPTLSWSSIINEVYLLDWLKGALISKYNKAIAIEIWHNDNIININIVIKAILEIITNLNIWISYDKDIYVWKWKILRNEIYKIDNWIKDFSLIKKWEIIWYDKNWNPFFVKEDTCLLWTNLNDNDVLCYKISKI